jgi:hypothetical protein
VQLILSLVEERNDTYICFQKTIKANTSRHFLMIFEGISYEEHRSLSQTKRIKMKISIFSMAAISGIAVTTTNIATSSPYFIVEASNFKRKLSKKKKSKLPPGPVCETFFFKTHSMAIENTQIFLPGQRVLGDERKLVDCYFITTATATVAGSITVILSTYHCSLSLTLHSEPTVRTQMVVSSNFFFPFPTSPFYTRRNEECFTNNFGLQACVGETIVQTPTEIFSDDTLSVVSGSWTSVSTIVSAKSKQTQKRQYSGTIVFGDGSEVVFGGIRDANGFRNEGAEFAMFGGLGRFLGASGFVDVNGVNLIDNTTANLKICLI